ncbi:MAG: hypothetical protein AAGG07_13885 [Planctomycetota bacterium]
MTAATSSSVTEAFSALLSALRAGDILTAFNTHYAEDIVMVEGTGASTEGFEANLEREKQFLASVKEWKQLSIESSAVTDNGDGTGSSFIEYNFDFINTDDQEVRYEQVARQTWRGGKIVNERFYYNAG